ncbi:MAG: ABC transporter ATP-binding protein [Thermotogaceae bacterium]|nr:ABC transporter ATP-binding protein [Thermotogaceae bacterium]
MPEPILSVRNLKTYFFMEEGVVKAVDGVSFDLYSNEVLGIVGETGSGKSVTVKSLMRLIKAPGKIVDGEIVYTTKSGEKVDILKIPEKGLYRIRGSEISMVFQDPMTSLNPLFTVGDQLIETIMIHQKLDKDKARKKAIEILDMVGIPEPQKRINSYPFEFSGGMRQRVVIAIALSCNPRILIADEPTTALDVTIQAQILDLFRNLQKEFKTAVIFITHDLGVIASMADRIMVMYGGKQMELGSADDVFYRPVHPYTHMLLKSIPRIDRRVAKLEPIPGQPPRMVNIPPVCPFLPRCPRRIEKCKESLPELVEMESGHFVRCFNPLKQEAGAQV